MRIRKRQVPFPLSSLSPVPISDPLINLNRPPPVVVQLHHYDPTSLNDAVGPPALLGPAHVTPQPSDRPIKTRPSPIGSTDGWDFSDAVGNKADDDDDHKDEVTKKENKMEEENHLEKEEAGKEGNDIRKESISSAEVVSGFHLPESSNSSSPSQGLERRWCEGEKAIPLKKRRASFVLDGDQITLVMDHDHHKDKRIINTTRTFRPKHNKKSCSSSRKIIDDVVVDVDRPHQQHDNHQQLGNNNNNNNINGGGSGGIIGNKSTKKARGGALMEGSRCSRVNGRGWRCCQQTLVGYSLCEHHLGKGRLRSMTSVRSRSLAKSTVTTTTMMTTTLSNSSSSAVYNDQEEKEVKPAHVEERDSIANRVDDNDDDDNDDDDDDDDDYEDHDYEKKKKKPLTITKKRMKLGMVKARSISSLLGQTNSTSSTGAIAMTDSK